MHVQMHTHTQMYIHTQSHTHSHTAFQSKNCHVSLTIPHTTLKKYLFFREEASSIGLGNLTKLIISILLPTGGIVNEYHLESNLTNFKVLMPFDPELEHF